MKPVLLLDVVGLTRGMLGAETPNLSALARDGFAADLAPALPAVTCSAQATMVTGKLPRDHGIVGNGWYFRELNEVWLWRQSGALIQGEKLWDEARRRHPSLRCANLFWWYNMNTTADLGVTPRPTYPADGRKLFGIYTYPHGLRLELEAKAMRVSVDAEQLPPVGRVRRPGCDPEIGRGVHVVPPEEIRAAERRMAPARLVPQLLSLDERSRLPPEPHFVELAEIPAVADDAVIARKLPRHHRRLCRAGHRGKRRREVGGKPISSERREVWCLGPEHPPRETHDVQEEDRLHDSLCAPHAASARSANSISRAIPSTSVSSSRGRRLSGSTFQV